MSLVITVIGLLFLDEIIRGLGASEILFPYCKKYLTVQLIFAVGKADWNRKSKERMHL